jgi:hypothetical protein
MVVFVFAVLAHAKWFHRGLIAVVRQIADDRKARTAIGAVGERVTFAAISWVQNFLQTIVARRQVGRDLRLQVAPWLGFDDLEITGTFHSERFRLDIGNDSLPRRLVFEVIKKCTHLAIVPFHFNRHAMRAVADEPTQTKRGGVPINRRTEANSLHATGNASSHACRHAEVTPWW